MIPQLQVIGHVPKKYLSINLFNIHVRLYRRVKIWMVKIWQIFGQLSISPNFSSAKVSLHTVLLLTILHLSILSPTTPGTGIVGIISDLTLYFRQIPHFWGSFRIKSPLKPQPAIPRNPVRNLICRIVSTVKVKTCEMHRIYHIMGFNFESTNCMDLQLFNFLM